MESLNIATGSRIMNLRLSQNLTREKLAECADISVQFLSDIEKGRKSMTVATLRKICTALNVTADYIINGTINCDTADEIFSMVSTLSPEQQANAKELLNIFIKAVK